VRFIHNSVLQNSDPIDFDLNRISGLHPKRGRSLDAYVARSSGDDHIARSERIERGAVLDPGWDVEDHLAQGCLLDRVTIQACHDSAGPEVGKVIRSHHPRAETAGALKVLSGRELMRVMLPVAHARVVIAGIARDAGTHILDAGEGVRHIFGNHLATCIATDLQPQQAAAGCFLTVHVHSVTHEALFVIEGVISLTIARQSYLLTGGDYVNIPAGTPYGYEFLDHRGKLLSWTLGGNAGAAYSRLGKPYEGTVYAEGHPEVDWAVLDSSVDTELVATNSQLVSGWSPKLITAPEGMHPFVLAASDGEPMIAGDQVYTILGNQTHSNGVFIALLTEGSIGPAIPKHRHEKVTELFHCLNGEMEMFAGDGFLSLSPEDFLHIPLKTAHSFQLKKRDTRLLGFITPGSFEPFFRYLCETFEGYRYPLVSPPFRFDRVMQNIAELDLAVLERPGAPSPVAGSAEAK
jgi:quercetin 2,3-dioxygenase